MTPPPIWMPCFSDPRLGVAFFDNITIEADRITDPRWDRVLPVLPEEQIFMTRMVRALLKERPGASVLDVGTGSGVFAIDAAQAGCAVTAIDILPRAIQFAKHNATKNSVPAVASPPAVGQIEFQVQDFALFPPQPFDVVLLNPPFNPTCGGFNPALHAKAGLLGQDCMEWQFPHAAKFVRQGGVCAGVHLMLLEKNDALPKEFTELVRESFPDAIFEYGFILPPIAVTDFLKGQYQSYLSDPEVSAYVARYPEKRFALIYFEARRAGQEQTTFRKIDELDAFCARCPWSWEKDRIPLHRRIIENTSAEHSIPAPAMFLEHLGIVEPLRSTVFLSKIRNSEPLKENSPLAVVNKLVELHRLVSTNNKDGEGEFDWLLVEAAPWYPTTRGRKALRSQMVIWASPQRLKSRARDLHERYQENTRKLQDSNLGPFLHPHFTGADNPLAWRGVHFSSHALGADPRQGSSRYSPFFAIVDEMLTELKKTRAESASPQRFETTNSYSVATASLEELGVGAMGNYQASREAWVTRVRAILNSLGLAHLNEDAVDLDLRHQAMHRALDGFVPNGSVNETSYFIGFPITFRSPSVDDVVPTGDLPPSFRGGIWIYASSARAWRPQAERKLLDIARLLSVLYETQYSELAAQELRRMGHREATSSIFHQIPKDFGAIDKSLHELREAAISDSATLETIRRLIPENDAMAFLIMAADAGVGAQSYQILPADIPNALEEGCDLRVFQSIYDRVVKSYVSQRIMRDEVPRSPEFDHDQTELEYEDRLAKYPLPVLEVARPFCIPKARDAYIWLVLALRSAAYHAYYPVVTGESQSGYSRIGVRYSEEEREIIVFNSAPPPSGDGPAAQIGWRQDIEVFKRAGQVWQIQECQPDQFSCWDESEALWMTRIKYIDS